MQITAALAHANGGPLSIEPVDIAEPVDDEILVRIVASGLCHTDLTILDQMPLPWPAILGHEGAGIVEKIGPKVRKVVPGDHVIMTTASCGRCTSCLQGQPSFCVSFIECNMSGGHRADGSCTHQQNGKPVFGKFLGQSSFATYVIASERSIIPVPVDLPLDLLAPLGCGIQTGAGTVLNTLKARTGKSFAVFGAGAVGLSALMAAKIAGCLPLIAVDTKTARLALAQELGATHVIDATRGTVVEEIQALTSGGVDYAVEAAGVIAVMTTAIQSLGINGHAVLVGVAPMGATVPIDPMALQSRGQTVMGTLMAGLGALPELFVPKLIEFWRAGLLPFDKLVRFYDFSDINDAIHDAHRGSTIKPILRMP